MPQDNTHHFIVDSSCSKESLRGLCRDFLLILVQYGGKSPLCEVHAIMHPELHVTDTPPLPDAPSSLCLFCGAGLEKTEGLSSL